MTVVVQADTAEQLRDIVVAHLRELMEAEQHIGPQRRTKEERAASTVLAYAYRNLARYFRDVVIEPVGFDRRAAARSE